MITDKKDIELVDSILQAARLWAAENIEHRYTGTMVIEIGFCEGGVRTPSVKETRVLALRRPKG
jgi:hypothetical protein